MAELFAGFLRGHDGVDGMRLGPPPALPFSKEIPMSDRKRSESKEIKKDQMVRRAVLDEIAQETAQDVEPKYRNPNRDQARGDWDRSRRHTDEGRSREGE